MAERDRLLDEFETIDNVNRFYTDEVSVMGTFKYEGNCVVVYWEPEGFALYSSAPGSKEEIAETFEKYIPVSELYISESQGEQLDFERTYCVNYNLDFGDVMVKGVARNLGFCAGGEQATGFPEDETSFSVFSDSYHFEYSAELVDHLHEVFPEIFEENVEVLVEDITGFALGNRETLRIT